MTKKEIKKKVKEVKPYRWFCLNINCNFFTDDVEAATDEAARVAFEEGKRINRFASVGEAASVLHQCTHFHCDPQLRCTHEPACESLYWHKEKSPVPGTDNW